MPTTQPFVSRQIRLRHPGYPSNNTLLILLGGDTARHCMSADVVHAAGAILSNNRFDGWLAYGSTAESPRVDDLLLAPGDYFFHVPGAYTYPVVPAFSEWCFPHLKKPLPSPWSRAIHKSAKEQATLGGGSSTPCKLSGRTLATERAHIVPVAESRWFQYNDMEQYQTGQTLDMAMNGLENVTCLSRDSHYLFDAKYLVFLPSCNANPDGEHEIIAYAWRDHEQLWKDWHQKFLYANGQQNIAIEYHFARFAWTIFGKLGSFFTTNDTRLLVHLKADREQIKELTSPANFQAIMTRSRRLTPTKRAKSSDPSQSQPPHNSQDTMQLQRTPSPLEMEIISPRRAQFSPGCYDEIEAYEFEPCRGRKRERSPNLDLENWRVLH